MPSDMSEHIQQQAKQQLSFSKQDELFGERAAIQSAYLEHIQQAMERCEGQADVRIAACILEPVLQVSGYVVLACFAIVVLHLVERW